MSLEDLTGSTKYIDSLNEEWPAGIDYPDAGDDHIRGIKNVLKNTFPNIGGPVTLTEDDLNAGSVPVGSRMLFWQAAAPVGWSRVAGFTDTRCLRVVPTDAAGGTYGGVDDPVVNYKVANHKHVINISSGVESATHQHSVDATYTNNADIGGLYQANLFVQGSGAPYTFAVLTNTGVPVDLDHSHGTYASYTNTESAQHYHSVSGETVLPLSGAANWSPRYLDIIVCEKDAY